MLAEWGYERNPHFELRMPGHRFCDVDHTRRGAWRAVFRGLGIVHGFENSWGPWQRLDEDQPGLGHLLRVRRFVTEHVPFHELRPAPEVLWQSNAEIGRRPQALSNQDRSVVVIYLPVGGEVGVSLPRGDRHGQWYDPRTGDLSEAVWHEAEGIRTFDSPEGGNDDRPWDWVLLIRA